tara:strand:- start:363 stop:569 length:207 start_codon:yes stop_codon:yes gene_type:complete
MSKRQENYWNFIASEKSDKEISADIKEANRHLVIAIDRNLKAIAEGLKGKIACFQKILDERKDASYAC